MGTGGALKRRSLCSCRSHFEQFYSPVTGGTVRTITGPDGAPWFVAKDVAGVLGYSNTPKAIKDHCKSPEILKGNESLLLTSSPRGVSIIPERDVYRLIIRSRLPEAEAFEEWVVGEVLPMIRKTGMYMHEDIYQKLMDDPKKLGQILLDYGEAKDELEKTRERLDHAIRTKAEINNKKTATAMGTASAAVRRERKVREGGLNDPPRTRNTQHNFVVSEYRDGSGWACETRI